MTRTFAVGDINGTQQRMLSVVTDAQAAGAAAVAPDTTCGAIDEACRAVIAEAGWGDAFVHGTGHGLGLQIHEPPWVRSGSDVELEPSHVVTVEPGVYLAGHGGVRVEDTLVVTADGARHLTHAPKEPAI